MDNSRGKSILIKYNLYSHFIGAIPPYYNKRCKKFVVPSNGLRLYILPTLLCINCFDLLYLWIHVSPNISPKNVDPQEFMNFYLHTISRTAGWLLSLLFYFKMKELMHFTNIIFHMEEYFKGNLIIFIQ